ncbi:hypothetical protein BC834DRAFT_842329 [Gloeopeniophorella convolvens]|nr:hypothetical protein BC834DRAFT_842329 [Gloeopeniophorella convolvens]
MYNNMHSEFPPHSSDFDPQKLSKYDVPPGPYRTTTEFNAFSNTRNRQASIPASNPHTFRDTSNLSQNFSIDLYGAPQSMSSPPHRSATSAFDHNFPPRSNYDFMAAPQGPPGLVGQNKGLFTNVDPFTQHKQGGLFTGPGAQQQQSQVPQAQSSQLNGLHPAPQGSFLHAQQMQSQTPYGPHLPTSVSAPTVSQTNHTNGATQPSSQEEISTIFVVGFPEDMQEREFQNMFTFSSGFEAATLKIPNKELTAYGSGSGAANSSMRPGALGYAHGGPNDPYNLVTINQGGVVVDGGRDGTTSSWQPTDDSHFSHLVPNGPGGSSAANIGISTRKQIIGFAKFRTRAEALEARDTLQGRRVDIEKGAVLKAEMAKKNLHTKRGIGPLPPQLSTIMGSGGGAVPPEALAGMPGMNGLTSLASPQGVSSSGEALSARERELGTLGAMGFSAGMNGRRDGRLDAHEEELVARKSSIAFGNPGIRSARDRVEDEERKWKEKTDAEKDRIPSSQRPAGNSLLAATAGESIGSLPSRAVAAPPWAATTRENPLGKIPMPLSSTLPPRPPSPPSHALHSSSLGHGTAAFPAVGSFGPSQQSSAQPVHPSLPSRPRAYSPAASGGETVGPISSASSAAGSQGSVDEEVSRSLASLALSTAPTNPPTGTGSTSPQLPSPASGASSDRSIRNGAVDQNPPINTLYVGNLPSSPPPPGYGPNHLEDSLRNLFSNQPGFRKLCFRQKSNGPMCFVEFVDVPHATKALNELYGSTLGGLVKGGGIRISYSKNPLGRMALSSSPRLV